MLKFIDLCFTLLHLAIIIFNLLGWIWPATRKLHLYLVLATIFCWSILGFWYGFGYCPITDWQWQIKEQLGETDLPNSFIKYFADKVTGKDISSALVDAVTAGAFISVTIVTLIFYFRQGRK